MTYGWKFTANSAITVGALGIFDLSSATLTNDHLVSLWKSDGSLVTSATVNQNSAHVTSSSSAGDWRSTTINPIQLTAGVDYVVGAFYKAKDVDGLITNPSKITTIPEVTFGGSRTGIGSNFPTGASADTFFGPNLFFTATAPVPEPTSLILFGSGLAGLAGRMAWRKRRPK
jgi:hypothetical protein